MRAWMCALMCACVCVRVGLVLRVDGGSRGSYILSQWPAGAYLEPQGLGYFIFPKHKPQAFATRTHSHTHKHMPAKAMSRLEPVCKNSILHTMFPCRNPFTVFSSSAPTVSENKNKETDL